jgi:hypothetical protein
VQVTNRVIFCLLRGRKTAGGESFAQVEQQAATATAMQQESKQPLERKAAGGAAAAAMTVA